MSEYATNVAKVFESDVIVAFAKPGQFGRDFRMERKQLGAREVE
jgi:hypothetical protein